MGNKAKKNDMDKLERLGKADSGQNINQSNYTFKRKSTIKNQSYRSKNEFK